MNAERRYLEDFSAGERIELGSVTVSEEEIVAFAQAFDPQPFHLDAQAAADRGMRTLIASGWHTASLWMRLFAQTILHSANAFASPGVESLRWTAPVRPGDTLSGSITVTELAPSQRRPDRGTLWVVGEMANQHGETVLQLRTGIRIARRVAPPA